MAILIAVTDRDVRSLQKKIQALLKGETEVWVYPDIPAPDQVEMCILWKHPADLLASLPNLGLISSMGAGVEHILTDPELSPAIPITRIVDEALTLSMRNYVLTAVLNIHKKLLFYLENQRKSGWVKPEQAERPLRIGMLGLGALGGGVACFLAGLGFEVLGYSLKPKKIEGVRCLSAAEEPLEDFVKRINTLICLLPSTPATYEILNYRLFRHMPRGSFLINAARGVHLRETDLLRAMEEGYIQEAWLDVFCEEPLPPDHPFWARPGLVVTPHIASITNQDNAAAIIANNYKRWRSGKPLRFLVDRNEGY